MMKIKQNLILLLLCIMLLGFFANFAQNGYGMALVGASLLITGLTLQLSAISTLPKNKIISLPVFIAIPSLLILSYFLGDFVPDSIVVPLLLSWFLYPLIAPPILKKAWKRKTGEILNFFPYYELVFLALFCFGFAFKIQHWPLAGVILVTSILIAIPYLRHIIKTIKSPDINPVLKTHYVAYHLFIMTVFIGGVFSIQHYTKAKIILFIPSIIIGLFLILMLFPSFKKHFSEAIEKLRWITRVVVITFLVLTLHFWARKFDLVPKLYSNEYPQAYEELMANSNNLTEEGIKNKERAYRYYEEYSKLLEAIEEENNVEQ
jgi:hypothetical protein